MKLIIASLVVFSLVIFFLFALFPADISVTRIMAFNQPKGLLHKKISDLRTWKNWNELLIGGPGRDITNSQSDKTDSNYLSIGGVSVERLKSGSDTVVTRWNRGRKSFTAYFVLTEMHNQVALEWTLHFHLRWYPWEKMGGMFYEKQLGPLMDNSLIRLRKELESAPE